MHTPEDRTGPPAFLFSELAIGSPLEEFRRVFAKKLRSFETSDDPALAIAYRRVLALGEEKLQARLGGDAAC